MSGLQPNPRLLEKKQYNPHLQEWGQGIAKQLETDLPSTAVMEGKISTSQKGFLPTEGCAEHSFTMESLICDTKRRRKDVRILWLYLRNAFGSVSHELLWFMMKRLEVPQPFIDLCQEIYQESSQRIRSGNSYTSDIPINVRIKQGCPLSPLLFNLALEAVLPILNQCSPRYHSP